MCFFFIEPHIYSCCVADRVFGRYDPTCGRSSVPGSRRDEGQRMGIQNRGPVPRDRKFVFPIIFIYPLLIFYQYNETINDLLGKGEFDKKKHEIKHDPKTASTRVTDIEVVPLHSSSQVRSLLAVAQSRRSVAATLVNERSSRSHSVFTLRISGVNVGIDGTVGTGERWLHVEKREKGNDKHIPYSLQKFQGQLISLF